MDMHSLVTSACNDHMLKICDDGVGAFAHAAMMLFIFWIKTVTLESRVEQIWISLAESEKREQFYFSRAREW